MLTDIFYLSPVYVYNNYGLSHGLYYSIVIVAFAVIITTDDAQTFTHHDPLTHPLSSLLLLAVLMLFLETYIVITPNKMQIIWFDSF